MKITKVFLILLAWLTIEGLISCCRNCQEPKRSSYTYKGCSALHLDNSGKEPIEDTSGSVSAKAYGIRLLLTKALIAHQQRPVSFLMTPAYAFSCGCPPEEEITARDSITQIRIFSLQDFDAQHGAGSDISEYFRILEDSYFLSIAEYLPKASTTLFSSLDLEQQVDFLLIQLPAESKLYRFRIDISLTNGQVLSYTTSDILLRS